MNRKDLLTMLTYRRPAGSATEAEFIARYIDPVPGMYADQFGNRILACEGAKVMIACHTDTVHRTGGRQKIEVTGAIAGLPMLTRSNCLGADDTAGVYAALAMIAADVPVTFVFHREEEIGGHGSGWLARKYPEWIASHAVCLSLDRRGTGDIITHQYGGRTASETFAASLGAALDMGHRAAEGIFTDSANYADLIPECSNISVGYRNEHTMRETLDTVYLDKLIERLVRVDWAALTVERDPDEQTMEMDIEAELSACELDRMTDFEWDMWARSLRAGR